MEKADEAFKAAIASAFAMSNHPNVPHLVDEVTLPSPQYLATCHNALDEAEAECHYAKWDVARQEFELRRATEHVAREVGKERCAADEKLQRQRME